jgi:NADH-quinone oxidoreductase subunit C
MNFEHTASLVSFINKALKLNLSTESGPQEMVIVQPADLKKICQFLYESEGLHFDFLNSISCIDLGPENGHLALVYTLSSIINAYSLHLKVILDRNIEKSEIDSISDIWRSADWHEREIFDFFGLKFKHHPDLRRILLPADWIGHPLRKDYTHADEYHGLKIKYER